MAIFFVFAMDTNSSRERRIAQSEPRSAFQQVFQLSEKRYCYSKSSQVKSDTALSSKAVPCRRVGSVLLYIYRQRFHFVTQEDRALDLT